MSLKILVFAGSLRAGSYNEKLAALAARELGDLGAQVHHISLKDYPLPLVDVDAPVPGEAVALRALADASQGMFLTTPEYNAGYTPLLKNALDWMSLAPKGVPATTFSGKVIAIGGASPGVLGGMRALVQLRTVLELGFGATLTPSMASVGSAMTAFKEDGTLVDERTAGFLRATLAQLVTMTKKLNA